MKRDFSVHCEHCQSMPDGYYCVAPGTAHEGKNGITVRECWYQYLYCDDWIFHPCPFFKGEIRIHCDSEGYSYGENTYHVRKIIKPDGEFLPELEVEAHY